MLPPSPEVYLSAHESSVYIKTTTTTATKMEQPNPLLVFGEIATTWACGSWEDA